MLMFMRYKRKQPSNGDIAHFMSKRSGRLKSSCTVEHCHLRPIASRTCCLCLAEPQPSVHVSADMLSDADGHCRQCVDDTCSAKTCSTACSTAGLHESASQCTLMSIFGP